MSPMYSSKHHTCAIPLFSAVCVSFATAHHSAYRASMPLGIGSSRSRTDPSAARAAQVQADTVFAEAVSVAQEDGDVEDTVRLRDLTPAPPPAAAEVRHRVSQKRSLSARASVVPVALPSAPAVAAGKGKQSGRKPQAKYQRDARRDYRLLEYTKERLPRVVQGFQLDSKRRYVVLPPRSEKKLSQKLQAKQLALRTVEQLHTQGAKLDDEQLALKEWGAARAKAQATTLVKNKERKAEVRAKKRGTPEEELLKLEEGRREHQAAGKTLPPVVQARLDLLQLLVAERVRSSKLEADLAEARATHARQLRAEQKNHKGDCRPPPAGVYYSLPGATSARAVPCVQEWRKPGLLETSWPWRRKHCRKSCWT